jgi:hypothetical protein
MIDTICSTLISILRIKRLRFHISLSSNIIHLLYQVPLPLFVRSMKVAMSIEAAVVSYKTIRSRAPEVRLPVAFSMHRRYLPPNISEIETGKRLATYIPTRYTSTRIYFMRLNLGCKPWNKNGSLSWAWIPTYLGRQRDVHICTAI